MKITFCWVNDMTHTLGNKLILIECKYQVFTCYAGIFNTKTGFKKIP